LEKQIVLCRCATVIERDALLTHLRAHGIQAWTEERTVFVRVSQSADLSFVGASATLGHQPYSVWVGESQAEEGYSLCKQFQQQTGLSLAGVPQSPWRYFYWWCIISFFIPVVGPTAALYFFLRALKSRERTSVVRLITGCVLWLFGAVLSWVYVRYIFIEMLLPIFHRS
jgi:hypothetical protein